MITFLIVLGILGYATCSVLTYKATFTHFQTIYGSTTPDLKNKRKAFAVWMAIWGPIGLLVAAIGSDFFQYGFSVDDEEVD